MVLKPQEVPEDVFWVLETYKLTWFSNSTVNIANVGERFRSLQTYMVLKQTVKKGRCVTVLDPYKLTWFSNVQAITTGNVGVLDPYKLTWFSNLKFKNFTVLTELLHTDICCKPIFLIPRCIFYHLKLNQAILLIQYMIIFTVQPFFL